MAMREIKEIKSNCLGSRSVNDSIITIFSQYFVNLFTDEVK